MKKILVITLCITFLICLSACSNNQKTDIRQYKEEEITMSYNQMTFRELADILEELGISHISDEVVNEVEGQWNGIPPEVLESMNKMEMLLTNIGRGSCESTNELKSSFHKIYSFDLEVFDFEQMYTLFLQGISSISNNEFEITQINEDTSKVDFEQGTGIQKINFSYNGNPYTFEATVNDDWFDIKMLDFMNQVFREEGNPKQLFFMSDGYQECIIFYCTQDWADMFTEKTGCKLYNKTQ